MLAFHGQHAFALGTAIALAERPRGARLSGLILAGAGLLAGGVRPWSLASGLGARLLVPGWFLNELDKCSDSFTNCCAEGGKIAWIREAVNHAMTI